MSTMRKISAEHRAERQAKREKAADAARAAQLAAFQELLKLGLVKPPVMRDHGAMMQASRQYLLERIMKRKKLPTLAAAADYLRARGHRVGTKLHEVKRMPYDLPAGKYPPKRNNTHEAA
jgi:hypothetical protein